MNVMDITFPRASFFPTDERRRATVSLALAEILAGGATQALFWRTGFGLNFWVWDLFVVGATVTLLRRDAIPPTAGVHRRVRAPGLLRRVVRERLGLTIAVPTSVAILSVLPFLLRESFTLAELASLPARALGSITRTPAGDAETARLPGIAWGGPAGGRRRRGLGDGAGGPDGRTLHAPPRRQRQLRPLALARSGRPRRRCALRRMERSRARSVTWSRTRSTPADPGGPDSARHRAGQCPDRAPPSAFDGGDGARRTGVSRDMGDGRRPGGHGLRALRLGKPSAPLRRGRARAGTGHSHVRDVSPRRLHRAPLRSHPVGVPRARRARAPAGARRAPGRACTRREAARLSRGGAPGAHGDHRRLVLAEASGSTKMLTARATCVSESHLSSSPSSECWSSPS